MSKSLAARLHPAPALRPARVAAVPADRLPRRGGARGRVAGAARGFGPDQGAPLLDAGARGAPPPGRRGKGGTFLRAQAALIRRARAAGLVGGEPVAAVDATGLEARHVSAHFGTRRGGIGHRQRAWPKLTAVVHTASHLIVGAVPGVGPSQASPDFAPAVRQAAALVTFD